MQQEDQLQQSAAAYTEFFSWGSDSDGQLALANSDDDSSPFYRPAPFHELPKSLSFDILISQVSCGDFHSAFISGDGFVFSVGKNMDGQLGVGDPALTHSSAPLLIDSLPRNPAQVSCGGSHSAVVYANGQIFMWGQGMHGALGLNTQANLFAPQAAGVPRAREVDCGKRHTLVVDASGALWVAGDNQFRQLGMDASDKVMEFRKVELGFRVKKCAAGVDHSLLLTDDNQVFSCGSNLDGNLGLGHTYSSDSFLAVHGLPAPLQAISAGRHSSALTADGRLFVWGPVFCGDKPLLTPQELRSNKAMRHVAVGEVASAVIDEDWHVYTWGASNQFGQLGRQGDDGQKMPQIVEALACKQVTSVAVGLDFVIALGQDFDEAGVPIEKKEAVATMTMGVASNSFHQVQPKSESGFGTVAQGYGQRAVEEEGRSTPVVGTRQEVKVEAYGGYGQNSQKKFGESSRTNSSFTKDVSSISHDKPPVPVPYSSSTTTEFYKQLDQAREETFTLKQRNRELQQEVNTLRDENEQIMKNADEEIKRMSTFIDKYTSELDLARKQVEQDCEQKLLQAQKERQVSERQYQEKIEQLVKEVERERGERSRVEQERKRLEEERQELLLKEKKYIEQLRQAQREQMAAREQARELGQGAREGLREGVREPIRESIRENMREPFREPLREPIRENVRETMGQRECFSTGKERMEEGDRNMSPLVPQKYYDGYQTNSYASRSPITNAYYQPFNSRQLHQQNSREKSFDRAQEPLSTSQHQQQFHHQQSDSGQIVRQNFQSRYPQAYGGQSTPSTFGTRIDNVVGGERNVTPPPQFGLISPEKQDDGWKGYQKGGSCVEEQFRKTSENSVCKRADERRLQFYDENFYQEKSPISEMKRQRVTQYQTSTPGPATDERREGSTLYDVKNRLALMQRNKEELEEKLKAYEAKIKQHFNK